MKMFFVMLTRDNLSECTLASGVTCIIFALFFPEVFFHSRFSSRQRKQGYWTLSCDHGLDFGDELMGEQQLLSSLVNRLTVLTIL